jgi:hypothetical protein
MSRNPLKACKFKNLQAFLFFLQLSKFLKVLQIYMAVSWHFATGAKSATILPQKST